MTRIPLFALLLGCPAGKDSGTDTSGGETGEPVDADGDGYSSADDCDDSNAAIHPGADETCDEVDQDCDGVVDEDPTDGQSYYYDADGDDYGDPDTRVVACGYGDGVVGGGSDCDDGDPTVNPGEDEICDGVDQDCDGEVDEGTVYLDEDGDGFGDPDAPVSWCEAPASAVSDATDCDDADSTVYPGASETWYDGVDSDCAGDSDYDADGDGYDSTAFGGEDCADDSPEDHPGEADEVALGASPSCGGLEVAAMVVGEAADDRTGARLSGGDVNGDGPNDLLTYGGGAARLFHGPLTGEIGISEADAIVWSSTDLTTWGGLVLGEPDLDGDSYADLLVESNDSDGYRTHSAFFGPVSGSMDVDDADGAVAFLDYATSYSRNIGDVNDDSLGDIAVGWISDAARGSASYGGAVVYVGPWTGAHDSTEAEAHLTDDTEGDGCGDNVVGPGDMNGDGQAEVILSCKSGAAIFEGPLTGEYTHSEADTQISVDWQFWPGVATSGDLDADGYSDLAMSTNSDPGVLDDYSGRVWFVNGPIATSGDLDGLATARWQGTGADVLIGTHDSASDFDADGCDDVLFSALDLYDTESSVWLVPGVTALDCVACDASDARWRIQGDHTEAIFGYLAAPIGDQSGDGYGDIAINATLDSTYAAAGGAVWVVNGAE